MFTSTSLAFQVHRLGVDSALFSRSVVSEKFLESHTPYMLKFVKFGLETTHNCTFAVCHLLKHLIRCYELLRRVKAMFSSVTVTVERKLKSVTANYDSDSLRKGHLAHGNGEKGIQHATRKCLNNR